MKNTFLLIIISLVLLASGTYVFYLYGYKEKVLVYLFSYLAILFGWILLLMSVFSLRKSKDKVVETGGQNKSRLSGFLIFLGFFGFIFLLIAHYMYLYFLSYERVEKILATQPTKITIATVTGIKERHSKTGSKLYAVLNYHTDTGEEVAEMRINASEFTVGEKLTIKYSVAYPDMYEVVAQYP